MRVAMVSCFMKTSYGAYTNSLCRAIGPIIGRDVDIISSNCGCGDYHAKNRILYGPGCRFFEFPHVPFSPQQPPGLAMYKYRGRLVLGDLAYWGRAQVYSHLSKDADVAHFQQVLGAFGSQAVFHWIRTSPKVRKVVTVHELDPYQLAFGHKNSTYNKADRIIVLFDDMKDRLVSLGVQSHRIKVVHYGTDIVTSDRRARDGILYYGGHHFNLDKGIEVLLKALKRILEKRNYANLKLKIHGHYGNFPPPPILDLVSSYGLTDHIVWLNNIYEEEMTRQYATSLFLVLPFKGSFAGMVATRAMACGLPVIGTKEAGLPDHLGELGIYTKVGDDKALEEEMLRLLDNQNIREYMSEPLVKRAEEMYSWEKIAADTVQIYRDVLSE